MLKSARSTDSHGVRTAGILLAVISVLYLAREILIPLAFAITLTLILSPAVAWLQKIHLGRVPAVGLVMLVTIAIAGGIGWVIFNQLLEVANELPQYRENIRHKVAAMRAPGTSALGRAAASVEELGQDLTSLPPGALPVPGARGSRPVPVAVVDQPTNEFAYVRDVVQPVLAPLGIAGIVLIFSVFLLIKQQDLRNRLFRLVGLDRLNVMTQALDDAAHRVSRYLMLQLLVNASVGVLCGVGLYLIGMPYAALWGTVVGILRIVPYVGIVASALLPLSLSLAVFNSWTPPLLVFLLFAVVELATANFIEPWLYGAHTGVSSLALLLTAVFWTALWGPAGLILSTPLTVCVLVLGRYVPQFEFLHVMLGDEPVLVTEAHFYQRLLAMDEQEARAIADAYRSENTLLQMYDSVMIPALTMVEQDRHKGGLDPDREAFLFLSIKEMLVEFSEGTPNRAAVPTPGRVLCLPASDEADEITAAMLAQLLEQAGYAAISFSPDPSLQQTVGLMNPGENDIFCISALPPFAFGRAKVLTGQLRQSFPGTRILVGVWGFAGDAERALQRFHPTVPDKLVTSLADAVQFVIDAGPDAHVTESART